MNRLYPLLDIAVRHLPYSFSRKKRGVSFFLVALTCVPLLSACGGGDEEPAPELETRSDSSSGSGDLCNLALLFLADPNSVCTTSSGSSQSTSTPLPPSPPPSSGSISIRGNVEYEPNDDLMNANAVDFAQSDKRVGFSVDGNINNSDDIHDSFTFTRTRAANFNIELCPPGEMICEQTMPIDTGTAFIEVLDQTGRILKSSADDGTNFGRMRFDAGVVYYVRVVAGDTMSATVGYTLTAYETD